MISSIPPEKQWSDKLSTAKIGVTMASPLTAYLLYQCEYLFTRDVPYAAATVWGGKNIVFFNPDYLMKISNKEAAFVLLHEVDHIFLLHIGRQVDMGYNPQLWNIATDYFINLHGSGAYEKGDTVEYDPRFTTYLERPSFALYREDFIGMSSDEIYHALLEENDGDVQEALKAHGGGEPGEGSGVLDEVSDAKLDPAAESRNKRAVSAAIAKATREKSIGAGEQAFVQYLSDLLSPKIHWADQLSTVIHSSTKERKTYNRLSRRSTGDIFFPSTDGKHVKVVFGIDSSGSMGEDELREAGSELVGIIEQFESWEVDLVTCDVAAHLIGRYSSEDSPDIDWKIVGGGGTDLQSIADYAYDLEDEEGEELTACIIVTDGFIPPIKIDHSSDLPIVIVVTSGGNESLEMPDAKIILMSNIGK